MVFVRPLGLTSLPARNWYQYPRPGWRPSTSTWTEWAQSGVAMVVPLRTTRVIASSSATCQETSTGSGGIPPPSSGFGARRVQSTTPSGAGSPEATPSEKGLSENTGFVCTAPSARDDQAAAAASDVVATRNERRFSTRERSTG